MTKTLEFEAAPIHAVVWSDFGVPLSLRYGSDAEAIEAAQGIYEKATFAHIKLGHIQAVRLDADNSLHVLWEPAINKGD